MSFDPNLDPGSGTTDTGNPTAGAGGSPNVGDYIQTPFGYLLVTGVDAITGEPKYQFIASSAARATSGGTTASSGGGTTSTNNIHTTERLIDPNQLAISQQQRDTANAQLAEQVRQFNEKLAYDRARGDQQQQLAEGQAAGMFRGLPTEQAREFNSRQALDYYTQLANTASNPRNFVQSFFQQRGQLPPAAANGQGNVDAIQRYLPFLLGGAQGAVGPSGSYGAPAPAAPSAPTGAVTPQAATGGAPAYANPADQAARVRAALGPGVSYGVGNLAGYDQNGAPINNPSAPQGQIGGGTPAPLNENPDYQRFRQNVGDNAASGSVTQEQAMNPKAVGPNGIAIYAHGGIVPEPVIGRGVHSGKTYMFGEHGPEGVVPANYLPKFLQQRGGQMMGGDQGTHSYAIGGIIGEDPYGGGYYPPATQSGYDQVAATYPTDQTMPGSPGTVSNPLLTPTQTTASLGDQTMPPSSSPTGATAPTPTAVAGPTNASGAYGTPGGYSAPQSTAPVPLTPQNNFNPFPPTAPAIAAPAPTTAPAPTAPAATGAVTPIVNQPLSQPQPSNNFNQAPSGTLDFGSPIPQGVPGIPQTPQSFLPTSLFPRDTMAPGTFGNPIGNRPQFLPGEDQPDPNSVLGQLSALNAVPPFLTRLFAQNRGIASQGTNTPQRMDLPKDLPLVSKLAYSQMTPSEQQALLSYASAYGITPEDYMNLIEQYSPQGPISRLPTFGTPLQFNRQ